MTRTGRDAVRVLVTGGMSDFAWLPDSRDSSARRRTASGVSTWEAAGRPASSVASSGEDSSPEWSPEGSRVVMRSTRSGVYELYPYAADGTDEKRITSFGAHVDNPRWSPDGAWIAFDGNRALVDRSLKHHNIYIVSSPEDPIAG